MSNIYLILSKDNFTINDFSGKTIFFSEYQRNLDLVLLGSLDCLEKLDSYPRGIIFSDQSDSFTSARIFATFINALVFAKQLKLFQKTSSDPIDSEIRELDQYYPEYDRIAPVYFKSNFKLRK